MLPCAHPRAVHLPYHPGLTHVSRRHGVPNRRLCAGIKRAALATRRQISKPPCAAPKPLRTLDSDDSPRAWAHLAHMPGHLEPLHLPSAAHTSRHRGASLHRASSSELE